MSWPMAFALSIAAASVFGAMAVASKTRFEAERDIAVACVQSGGKWGKPRFFSDMECSR